MRRSLVATLAALLLAAACGGDDKEAAPRPKRTTTTSTTAPPPAAPPANIAPLRGIPADPAVLGRPLLVVKIDNAPKARPQSGINEADVVVEEQVEGGVTRLAALFHSAGIDPLGPVRSARSTDILLLAPLRRPLFGYAGTNAVFQRQVDTAPLVDVNVDRQPGSYHRRRDRPAPYNLFTSSDALWRHAPPGSQPPVPMFQYRAPGEALAAPAEPARKAHMQYRGKVLTDVDYEWDGSGWARTQNGTPHVDMAGKRVAPPNVIIQFTTYHETGLIDRSGSGVPEADLIGGGEAWILTDGKVVKGKWAKPSAEVLISYTDANGAPVKLTPGQTWVELNPPNQASVSA